MKISVTREHLNEGTPFDPKRCPIALAIRDSIADLLNVEVSDHGVWIQLEDGTEFYAQLPRMKWMRLYDKGIISRPESFDLKWKEIVRE